MQCDLFILTVQYQQHSASIVAIRQACPHAIEHSFGVCATQNQQIPLPSQDTPNPVADISIIMINAVSLWIT